MPRETAAVRLLAGDKEPARLASTANLALAGLLTVDGVVTVAGDRVLVKDQTDATENGIYTVSEGTWRRASDSSSSRLLIAGMKVSIQEGTAHGGDVWVLATDRPDIGDDDIEWIFYLSTDTVATINETAESINQAAIDFAAIADDILATAWAATNAADFASVGVAELVSIPVGMTYLRTAGYAAAGDGGAALYKRVVSLPSAVCGFQSADGAYWQICERVLRPEMFSGTANTTAIQRAIDAANALGIAGEVRLTNRNYRAVTQSGQTYCLHLYGKVSLVGEAPGEKDGVTAGTGTIISWGTNILDTIDIISWTGGATNARISGIQFMPDDFTGASAIITGNPLHGNNIINVDAGPSATFSHAVISDCTFGPCNGHSLRFSHATADWAGSIITRCNIWGGIKADTWLDNNLVEHNDFNGDALAMDITQTAGAGNLIIQHNNGISAGGGVFLRNGFGSKILNNYFETVQTFSGVNGYYFNINGTAGSITNCEFKGNIVQQLGAHSLTGLVFVDNTVNADFDNNVLLNSTATIAGIVISANNSLPYLGRATCSGVTSGGVNRTGYLVTSPATVLPIGFDVPLTLQNGWVAAAESPTVRRERDGSCHISGGMTSGTITAGTTLFTLPAGFRPAANTVRTVPANTGTVNILIVGTGVVSLIDTGNATFTGVACTFMAVTD